MGSIFCSNHSFCIPVLQQLSCHSTKFWCIHTWSLPTALWWVEYSQCVVYALNPTGKARKRCVLLESESDKETSNIHFKKTPARFTSPSDVLFEYSVQDSGYICRYSHCARLGEAVFQLGGNTSALDIHCNSISCRYRHHQQKRASTCTLPLWQCPKSNTSIGTISILGLRALCDTEPVHIFTHYFLAQKRTFQFWGQCKSLLRETETTPLWI